MKKQKAIFLDRDGVINENVKELSKLEDFKILPNVEVAIKKINDAGYLAIIVTNQPIISKGFLTFETLNLMHDKLKHDLKKHHAHIDDIFVCPHHPKKGFPGEIVELKIDCDCRKPKPGLFLQAIKKYNIDVSKSWIIGDSKSDILAGEKIGVKTIFIPGKGSGAEHESKLEDVIPDYEKVDLLDAVNFILKK